MVKKIFSVQKIDMEKAKRAGALGGKARWGKVQDPKTRSTIMKRVVRARIIKNNGKKNV